MKNLRRVWLGCAIFLASAISLSAAWAASGYRFRVDTAASSVHAKVSFMGLGSQKAQFPISSGNISMASATTNKIALSVNINAKGLTSGSAETTKKLKGPDFFNVSQYPDIVFDGQTITMANATTGTVSGKLTARGITKPVNLAVTFSKAPTAVGAGEAVWLTGTTSINRKEFGMTAYSVVVGKTVKITIKSKLLPN